MKYLPSGLAFTPWGFLGTETYAVRAVLGSLLPSCVPSTTGTLEVPMVLNLPALTASSMRATLKNRQASRSADIMSSYLAPISTLYWLVAASLPSNEVATRSQLPSISTCQRTSMVSASTHENSERYLVWSSMPELGSGMPNSPPQNTRVV